jgi:hypothetical protein
MGGDWPLIRKAARDVSEGSLDRYDLLWLLFFWLYMSVILILFYGIKIGVG